MFSLTSKMYSSVTGSRWKLLNCICLSDPFTDGNMLHPSGRLSCQLSFFSFRINWPHLIGECVLSLIHVQFSVTPWTVTCQAPLSMGFPRQEYWSGSPFPSPVKLVNMYKNSQFKCYVMKGVDWKMSIYSFKRHDTWICIQRIHLSVFRACEMQT